MHFLKSIFKPLFATSLILCLTIHGHAEVGIRLSQDYPGYWSYNGKTTLLIGAWNHGHNPFLDHSTLDGGGYKDSSTREEIIAALDELALYGGNLIRCVLDPGAAAGNQGFDFCRKVDGRYDLNHMEGRFWDRLDWFLNETKKREIVVGLEIWDRFDWYEGGHEGWPGSPFNPRNNLNYTSESSGLAEFYPGKGDQSENPFGHTTPKQSYYLESSMERKAQLDLVRGYQELFMDRLLSITFDYDHVLYSANNEVRHQEPAWGQYWIAYLRSAAELAEKTVLCTDMFWDLLHIPDSEGFEYQLRHLNHYDYLDISQTSAHPQNNELTPEQAGEVHWAKVRFAAEKAHQANRLIHLNKIYGSPSRTGGWMGSAQNAVEEFWRSLIVGAAGARFHRPDAGLGLSKKTQIQMRAVRLVEEQVQFWEVNSAQDLLIEREDNEAYLAANPGQKYLIYFPLGGSVGLDLRPFNNASFKVDWISVSNGESGHSDTVRGGGYTTLTTPGNQGWVATIVASD